MARFVVEGARNQINIGHERRGVLEQQYENEDIEYAQDTFNSLYQQVLDLLGSNSFITFRANLVELERKRQEGNLVGIVKRRLDISTWNVVRFFPTVRIRRQRNNGVNGGNQEGAGYVPSPPDGTYPNADQPDV